MDAHNTMDRLPAMESPNDLLSRTVAGYRAATLNKLLFCEDEVAVVLGVSPETLKVWRRDGRGPRWVRVGDKLIRYTLGDLQAYVTGLTEARAA